MKTAESSDHRDSIISRPIRSFDYEALDRVVADYKDEWVGFDAKELVSDPLNVLLQNGDDFALFEGDGSGTYNGHYLFTSRGTKALDVAREFLTFFLTNYDVNVIMGYTPVEHKGAQRLNILLGFTFHDIVETEAGPHWRVSMKKDEFNG